MKKKAHYIALMIILLTSCGSPKNVLYLQDAGLYYREDMTQKVEVTIQPDDVLSIVVSSRNPELAQPFNLSRNTSSLSGTSSGLFGYTVDIDGNIDFPVLGKIYATGLTRVGLQELIKSKLKEEDYIKDPIVNVQFQNFKISVLGEVSSPGVKSSTSDRLTIFEAISLAGDLKIQARRDRVAVIREKDGVRTILYNDLRSTEIFDSPCYYLQQNDIIYVEPNKTAAENNGIGKFNNWSFIISTASLILSTLILFKVVKV